MLSPQYQHFKHLGIITDLPPEEVSDKSWTDCNNIQFTDLASSRVGGYDAHADPLLGSGVIFTTNVVVGELSYWLYCSTTHIYVTEGTNHWDITPDGMPPSKAGDWTSTVLNGVPVLNNTVFPPIYWDLNTASKCQILPGWDPSAYCKVIRSFKFHLVALAITDGSGYYPDTLWWSESAKPGTIPQEWVPTPSNDAGDLFLADTPGGILDGLALRDAFIVYKDTSTYALSYVAGQLVYSSQKLFLTTGVQSANCVLELNGEHWVFSGSDVIRHDGQSYKSVVDLKVKHELVTSIEPSKLTLPCLAARMDKNQVWVCIPVTGSDYLNRAYVIDLTTGSIGVRDLPNVAYVTKGLLSSETSGGNEWDIQTVNWDQEIIVWDQQQYSPTEDSIIMCGTVDNKLWAADRVDTADGQPITAFVERLSVPTNDNILRALITSLVPRISGQAGETIYISVGGQAFFDTPITWSDPQPFVIGQDAVVHVQVEGRLISTRFEATTFRQWRIHSYKVAIVDQGLY